MNDKRQVISIILSITAIVISVAAVIMCILLRTSSKDGAFGEGDVQYVLYLGTNDKDTNEPVYTPEEAQNILRDILLKYVNGYNIQESDGGWISEDGTRYQEYALVIYLSDTSTDKVHALCDELISVFDQSEVLIRMNRSNTEFYKGSGK